MEKNEKRKTIISIRGIPREKTLSYTYKTTGQGCGCGKKSATAAVSPENPTEPVEKKPKGKFFL